MTTPQINAELVQRILDTVDKGLTNGLGQPTPGNMCVEAAVCFAMGLPHSDNPGCVDNTVRTLKIALNDASAWPSADARAKGMRRLAIAQLGTKDNFDSVAFVKQVSTYTIKTIVPLALRAAAAHFTDHHAQALTNAAVQCEELGTARAASDAANAASDAARYAAANAASDAADAADAATYADAADAADAARYAARYAAAYARAVCAAVDAAGANVLNIFAEGLVQILIGMKTPGSEFLYLTE